MNSAAVYSCGCARSSAAGQFIGALQGAGVQFRDSVGQQAVLLFDEPDEQVRVFLRGSGRGGHRVLAVSMGRPLAAGEADGLLAAGATDVLGQDGDDHSGLAGRIKARLDRWSAVDALLDSGRIRQRLVGGSPVWQAKLRELAEAAHFTASPVLLIGESGTGKELAAQLIHELDPRPKKGGFVVVDCTTLTPDLAGSELFGHERGAFTGAVGHREGAFVLARNGTLFLDEIGELPLPLQAQLLRVLQEGACKRVGGNEWQRSEFRLVCATNRDLEEEVRQGRFRADLYFRIAGLRCALPPLRERTEDILPLVRHFICELRPDEELPEMDEAVRAYFLCHDYPGNVRELKQRVHRVMHRYPGGGLLSVGSIPPDERPVFADRLADDFEQILRRIAARGFGLKEIRRWAEELTVQIALEETGGNLQQTARLLGITDRALQMRRAKERGACKDLDPPQLVAV